MTPVRRGSWRQAGARSVLAAAAGLALALLVAGAAGCSSENPVAPHLAEPVSCSSCPTVGYCPLACTR